MRKKPQYATLNRRKVRGKMTLEYMSGMLGFRTCNIVPCNVGQSNNIEILLPQAVSGHLISC